MDRPTLPELLSLLFARLTPEERRGLVWEKDGRLYSASEWLRRRYGSSPLPIPRERLGPTVDRMVAAVRRSPRDST